MSYLVSVSSLCGRLRIRLSQSRTMRSQAARSTSFVERSASCWASAAFFRYSSSRVMPEMTHDARILFTGTGLEHDGLWLNRSSGRLGSPLPSGEVDLRSKSGEGRRSHEGPQPLTRRCAPTSPKGRGGSKPLRFNLVSSRFSRAYLNL